MLSEFMLHSLENLEGDVVDVSEPSTIDQLNPILGFAVLFITII
jgi:hypothetical protein